MNFEKIILKKTCSFYVSDFHISTILLPYIENKIKNDVQIETFLEKELKEKIEKVTKVANLNEYIKKEILDINWGKIELVKCPNIFENIEITARDINIIVCGSRTYVERVNYYIDAFVDDINKRKVNNNITITINNCYSIDDVIQVGEILDKHSLILNTSGEVGINTVFQDYKGLGGM